MIAYGCRVDMLIGNGIFDDGINMDSPFMGKGGMPNKRMVIGELDVTDFADVVTGIFQALNLFIRNGFEFHFGMQNGDDGSEVRVSAAFSEPVERPLNLGTSFPYGGQTVGDRQIQIVVGVNSQRRFDFSLYLRNNFCDLQRQASAIGVAENNAIGF